MKYRKLAGQDVSILGLGIMRLPVIDNDLSKIDEPEAVKMLHSAIDQGINYIDTAWTYHGGESEPFTGKALKNGLCEKVYLATKLPIWLIESKDDCDKYLNEQLERLQTDHIDFYLIHGLDESRWQKTLDYNVIDFLEKAKKDGRIRFYGFSFHDHLNVFKKIVDAHDWQFCQIQYNYMDENFQAGTDGLKYATDKGIDIVVMEPLKGGKLAKKIPDEVERFLEIRNINTTSAKLGLRWLWDKPEISCVLSGMSTMEHIEENCQIADAMVPYSLSTNEKAVIRMIRDILLERSKVECTTCGYCLPCPEGVNIPLILQVYNDLHIYGDEKRAKQYYNIFVREEYRADKCIECGECLSKCPQKIEIIDALKDAHKALTD